MVRIIFSLFMIIIFGCCKKQLHELSMNRTPYTSNELRIDGYYYSSLTSANDIGVAVFYRNGVCIHVYTRIDGQDTLRFVENNILLNESLINRFMNTPTSIGVFQINGESIVFETWEAGRDIITFSSYGEILNDTTFLITKQINNDSGKSTTMNLTFRFKQFSPKPDSTNTFIK